MEDSDFEGDEFHSEEERPVEVLDPDNPEHFFPIVERDFNKTIANLEQNPEALQFTEDFNKLFEAFFQTYSRQKELETLAEDMKFDLTDKAHKIELSLRLADEDQKTIIELRKQIENAWKLADAAHAREQLAHEIIDNLRRQVENLNAEIDFKNKMNQDTDETGELSKHKDGLERERDRLVNEVTQLNTKLQNAVTYQEELEKKNSEADMKINEIAGQLEDQTQETSRQKRAKEKLEADIQDFKFKIDEKDIHIHELNENIKELGKQISALHKEIKDWRYAHDKLSKELEGTLVKLAKLTDEHNTSLFERLTGKEVLTIIKERDETTIDRNNLRQRIGIFEKEIEDFKKYIDEDKRTIETLGKEKDILNKTIQRQQVVQKDHQKLIHIQEQSKKKLELELDLFFIESGKHKKLITQLERERDRLAEEQLDLTNTIQDQLEDIRQKKVFIFDLKKEAAERDNKIRQQQNMYEAMRSDRNALQKLHQESTAEAGELKKKLRLVSHQIEQLKENIGQKEKQLIKDESIVRKLTKEKEQLK
ncbi:unnamed protein product [Diabrotica balteata]|uniref:Cilia- and flagella-associated protein 58 central coiled coil domain-containing protein n=1 Tax=Diabrotica balteata TaxID=107213 RepID=A0A9N9XCS9_DIABA|nr:unnamed protein product [Diabrotica balteata]